MIRVTTFFLAVILFVAAFAYAQKQYNGYPPLAPNNVQRSGRFTVNNSTGKALFYWLNEADTPSNKLVIWLSGGPGCASSGLANIFENEGPMTVDETTGELKPSKGPWTKFANVMWLDQPCGVGFSTCGTGPADTNTEEAAEDFYNFLQAFMDYYPQYRNMEVFVSAESFGGTWGVTNSYRIYQANNGLKPQGKYKINLQGITLGDGLTSPKHQYPQYPNLAYHWCKSVKGAPCVSESVYNQMVAALPKCLELIEACTVLNQTSVCDEATAFCNGNEMDPYTNTGLNFYDITRTTQYNMDALTTLMNKPEVQMALLGETNKAWNMCNYSVNAVYARSWEHDRDDQVIAMVESGIRMLMYAGTYDFAVNFLGVKAWTLDLQWSQQRQYVDQPDAMWFVNELPAGQIRTIQTKGGAFGFSFASVFSAGHMVPHDQPVNAQALISQFVSGQPFPTWPWPLMPTN